MSLESLRRRRRLNPLACYRSQLTKRFATISCADKQVATRTIIFLSIALSLAGAGWQTRRANDHHLAWADDDDQLKQKPDHQVATSLIKATRPTDELLIGIAADFRADHKSATATFRRLDDSDSHWSWRPLSR